MCGRDADLQPATSITSAPITSTIVTAPANIAAIASNSVS